MNATGGIRLMYPSPIGYNGIFFNGYIMKSYLKVHDVSIEWMPVKDAMQEHPSPTG